MLNGNRYDKVGRTRSLILALPPSRKFQHLDLNALLASEPCAAPREPKSPPCGAARDRPSWNNKEPNLSTTAVHMMQHTEGWAMPTLHRIAPSKNCNQSTHKNLHDDIREFFEPQTDHLLKGFLMNLREFLQSIMIREFLQKFFLHLPQTFQTPHLDALQCFQCFQI